MSGTIRSALEVGVGAGVYSAWLRYEGPRRTRFLVATTIRLADGTERDTPTGAAMAATGTIVNGWAVWHVERNGESLTEMRKRLSGHKEIQ